MIRIVNHPKVDKSGRCWRWTGGKNLKGYGGYGYRENGKQKTVRVHRLAYLQERGPIPDGMQVLHHCDVRDCLNPDHLWIGTASDNMRDMVRKGRDNPYKSDHTHCKQGHEFTPENTGVRSVILRPNGTRRQGRRYCRECKRIASAKYNKKRRPLPAWCGHP